MRHTCLMMMVTRLVPAHTPHSHHSSVPYQAGDDDIGDIDSGDEVDGMGNSDADKSECYTVRGWVLQAQAGLCISLGEGIKQNGKSGELLLARLAQRRELQRGSQAKKSQAQGVQRRGPGREVRGE